MADYKNKIEKVAEKTFGEIKNVHDLKRRLYGKFVDNDEVISKNKLSKKLVYDGLSDSSVRKDSVVYNGHYLGGVNPSEYKSDYSKRGYIKVEEQEKHQKDKIYSREEELPHSFKELNIEELRKLSSEDLVAYEAELLSENKKLEEKKAKLKKGLEVNNSTKEKKEEKLKTQKPRESIDNNESELDSELEKLDKKGFFGKAFEAVGTRLFNVRNRVFNKYPKLEKSLVSYSEWMNKGGKWNKLGKRILISGSFGLAAGTAGAVLSGGSLFLAGAVGGGLALKRVVARFTAGAGAGFIHKKATEKGLEKRIKEKAFRQYTEELNKDIGSLARDRKLIRRLRKELTDGTISIENKAKLEVIEKIRKKREYELSSKLEQMRKVKDVLRNRLIKKNERNNILVAGVAGLLAGFSLRYGADIFDKLSSNTIGDLINHGDTSNLIKENINQHDVDAHVSLDDKKVDSVNTNTNQYHIKESVVSNNSGISTQEGTQYTNTNIQKEISSLKTGKMNTIETYSIGSKVEDIPEDAYIKKGDGITQLFKKQFEGNPKLAEKFGIKNGTGKEYAELSKKLGYLNDDYEVRLKLDTDKGYFATLDKNGKPIVLEVDKSGNVLEKSYFGREFEDKNIEKEYEYIGKRSTGIKVENNSGINEIESKRIGDLNKGRMDLSGKEIVGEDGVVGRKIKNLDFESSSDIGSSNTLDINNATTGKEVFDNHADVFETIDKEVSGDTKNLLITYFKDKKNPFIRFGSDTEVESLGGNYLKVKVPKGMTAVIEYDKYRNTIKSVMYHSYKNGMHSEFIDSNGDGKIDRYVHSYSKLDEKDYLKRNFHKNKSIKDSGEYIIEFKNRNGMEEMIMSSHDNKVVLRDHNEIEKMRLLITRTESVDINKFK